MPARHLRGAGVRGRRRLSGPPRPAVHGHRRAGRVAVRVPAGFAAGPGQFPARNRIIAALADVVIVVEAALALGGAQHRRRGAAPGPAGDGHRGIAGTDRLLGRRSGALYMKKRAPAACARCWRAGRRRRANWTAGAASFARVVAGLRRRRTAPKGWCPSGAAAGAGDDTARPGRDRRLDPAGAGRRLRGDPCPLARRRSMTVAEAVTEDTEGGQGQGEGQGRGQAEGRGEKGSSRRSQGQPATAVAKAGRRPKPSRGQGQAGQAKAAKAKAKAKKEKAAPVDDDETSQDRRRATSPKTTPPRARGKGRFRRRRWWWSSRPPRRTPSRSTWARATW